MDPSRIDNIGTILGVLRTYQKNTHGIVHSHLSDSARMELMRNYSLALMVEQTELLQELPWKPWGYSSSDMSKVNWINVLKEWTDCLVFLLDQALCLGLSAEEIVSAFYSIIKEKTETQSVKPQNAKGITP